MFPLKRDNNAAEFTEEATTKELALGIYTMASTNNFYRVYVPVNVTGAARFRIRRTTVARSGSVQPTEDRGGFILLDNIQVSYPKMTARMEPFGDRDPELAGRAVLGWGGAMATPFPAVGAKDVLARVKPIRVTSGLTNVSEKTLITQARLHYRWRYLDQRTNDWKTVKLEPANNFVADEPLELPSDEGDIEFWLENDTQIPYFRYYDYAATGLGLGPSGYSEAVGVVTNTYRLAARARGETAADLPNGGEHWFFRPRAGASRYERIVLDVKDGAGGHIKAQPVDFELAGDHVWRAFLQTPSNAVGEVSFRVRATNLQDVAAAAYATNVVCWKLTTASVTMGANGIGKLTPAAFTDEPAGWSTLVVDDKAGYAMIQIDDDAMSLTAVHGEKQDFNAWSDAHKTDGKGLFVGQSRPGEPGASGTSAQSQKPAVDFRNWYSSLAVDPGYWREASDVDPEAIGPGKTYPLGVRFGSADTPNGWQSGPGQWAASSYGDAETGLALQMEGQGAGYLQFTDGGHTPHGLKSIRFTSRLAQFIGFNTFAYWDDTDDKKTAMKDYTFFAKGAFDTEGLRAFAGAASLSIVAYYRPNVGCYEFRLTQKTAVRSGSTPTGAGLTRTLQLFRWSVDAGTGLLAAEQLGADFDVLWTEEENGTWLTTGDGSGVNFPQLYISCSNSTDGATTVIHAGVSRKGQFPGTTTPLESACLTYADSDSAHLTAGTFGLGSANCPARFCGLNWCKKPSIAVAAPAAGALTKTEKATPVWGGTTIPCADDIRNYEWAAPADRLAYAERESSTGSLRGFRAKVFPQQIEVYTAPKATGKWGERPIETFDVDTFGAAGLSATNTIWLYTTGDSMVRIKMAGDSTKPRCDVIIDDVEVEQWRGENFDDSDYDSLDRYRRRDFPSWNSGSPTSYVFTAAWINDDEEHSVKLSARRTTPDLPSALRTPLMDGLAGQGVGLGFVSIAWKNAQTNANLLVQVATNNIDRTELATATKSVSEAYWSTVTNLDFSTLTDAERRKDSRTWYLGFHGVKGTMRVVVDPALVTRLQSVSNETAFGEVDIVSMSCSDEPPIDERSWWGWNLRTTDEAGQLWLGDRRSEKFPSGGMAFALNNSVVNDVRDEYGRAYAEHLPFLQTPVLAEALVGEVRFKARRYSADVADGAGEKTYVTLYGANSAGTPDKDWKWVDSWEVTGDVYTNCLYRAKQGVRYAVLRLAVTGVESVKTDGYMPRSKPGEVGHKPLRVLIDEMTVCESVEARVAFRDVRAFRYHLDDTLAVPDIMAKEEQPLCKEAFGVQGEIYAAQLGDEVDLSKAQVFLWWYPQQLPWGFENWREMPQAKRAELKESSDTRGVFRSSYLGCPGAVIEPQSNRGTVQFMLEVVWKSAKDGSVNTNWLQRADWVNPEWYSPVDWNARADQAFSGYTILDSVAPGGAWINEFNVFGDYLTGWVNTDKALQYLEVAAPGSADLSDWTLRFVYPRDVNEKGGASGVTTNVAAQFGRELPGLKKGLKGLDADSGYVFHVLASPLAEPSFDAADGRADGFWRKASATYSSSFGELYAYEPVSVQLVRPSGIVESEITAIGTTRYYPTTASRNPELHVDYLNAHEPGGHWIYVGQDETGGETEYGWSHALGVFANNGCSALQWQNDKTMTPGRKNEGQTIDPDWPRPLGSSVVVFATIEGGHLRHQVGDSIPTNATMTLVFPKGDPDGTNITYTTDAWYEMGPVTVNGKPATPKKVEGAVRTWQLEAVAKNVSNDVTVTARAAVDARLERDYGLKPDDPYCQAVVDWLTAGENMAHQPWHDADASELGLADFVNSKDEVVTNLNLKEMYWLDIDPTWPMHVMRVKGYMEPPTPLEVQAGVTNVRTSVFMMITNTSPEATETAWAPYVLRGSDPAFTSWTYAQNGPYAREWGDETFKITGILVNGDIKAGDFSRKNWLPLRHFVFNGHVEGTRSVSDSFDGFTSQIEVKDPYQKDSPGYSAGWYDWVQKHGWCPVFWSWDLNERTHPQSIEVLRKVNHYTY